MKSDRRRSHYECSYERQKIRIMLWMELNVAKARLYQLL